MKITRVNSSQISAANRQTAITSHNTTFTSVDVLFSVNSIHKLLSKWQKQLIKHWRLNDGQQWNQTVLPTDVITDKNKDIRALGPTCESCSSETSVRCHGKVCTVTQQQCDDIKASTPHGLNTCTLDTAMMPSLPQASSLLEILLQNSL